MLRHRLRLFDAVVSPTMNYISGTEPLTKEHERMIQSTQRKMFRLVVQTERRHRKIGGTKRRDQRRRRRLKIWAALKIKMWTDKAQTHNDQDNDISLFENDTDDEIDTTAIEE